MPNSLHGVNVSIVLYPPVFFAYGGLTRGFTMKHLIVWVLVSISFNSTVSAQEQEQIVEAQTINVDGFVQTERPAVDPELQMIHTEIKRQKIETALNKEKAKHFQELSKSVGKLSETTEAYLEEKKAAQEQIAEYNLKVKCLQSDAPGAECAKYVRRR